MREKNRKNLLFKQKRDLNFFVYLIIMMVLTNQPYFYFVEAIKIAIDLVIGKIVDSVIDRVVMMKKEIIINFFRLFLR